MGLITKELNKKLENYEYLEDILSELENLQKENNYTDEKMANDLDVALWRAYVYNNRDSYDFYELSEKTLAKVKEEGIKNGVWCYRYSCALVYLRRFDEALEYSRLGTKIDPSYPWGWLQLGRLCYKYNFLDEAFSAIDKGLELVPNDYEFLTLKDDIENDRGYAYANSHYINEETDKNLEKRLINVDDEELYNNFLNKSDLEKKLDILHEEDKNQEIIDIINSLPKEELTYNIIGKLARAYNNNGECEKGLEILLSVKDEGENTSLWNFRVGYSYYYSGKLEEAQKYFERCLELNPDEPDADALLRYTYSDLGSKKLDEEKNEEGLEYFNKIFTLAKNSDDFINAESDLGWAYAQIGNCEEALIHLEKAKELGRDDIWLHSEFGFCFGSLGRFEEALEEFKKSIELGRDDEWIFERMGVTYKSLGKFEEALEYYSKALELDSENIYLLSEMAWIYDNVKNNTEKGLEYLNKAKELGRDDVWLNSEFGWVYDHIKEYEKALPYLEKAKELGRDDEWIYFELGYSLARQNKVKEAIEYFKKAEELGKNDVMLYTELGYWLNISEKSQEALSYLEKAKELIGKDDIWIYSELGDCLSRLKRFEESLIYLEKAKELGRDDDWIFTQLGFTSKNLLNYENALEYYLKANEIGRNDEWINMEIAECLDHLGKLEEALARLQSIQTNDNENKIFIDCNIGYLYGKMNNSKEALIYLYDAEKLGRGDIWLYSEIGWNLADDSTTYDKALEYFNKAVSLGRDDEWIHGQIGFVLGKLGKKKEAIKHFEKAIFIKPEDSWLSYQLGSLYRKAGEIPKAIEILENVLIKNEFKGWIELELAWCYALIDEKEKSKKYLDEADSFIGMEKEKDPEIKKDFESIKQLLQSMTLLS
ncbi:tetratricopeptide repeat protein [Fusobacterium sp.]|uniref:tetratricopeptide repeat protein n=1 Tax=Fusobacterium sp. TaxID=68766 RepID=UPI00345B6F98